MSVAASADPSPIGYVIECRSAWVRAQIRSVASVISVTGGLDGANVEAVLGHLSRFTTLGSPLIVDVDSADIGDSAAFEHLLATFGAQCRRHSIEWVLVAKADRCHLSPTDEQHVLHADSVAEGLQHFVWASHARRNIPQARKTRGSGRGR